MISRGHLQSLQFCDPVGKKCLVPILIKMSKNQMEAAMVCNQTRVFSPQPSKEMLTFSVSLISFLLTVDHLKVQSRLALCPSLLPNNSITI